MKNNYYAVLTGDIVGSGKLEKGILARDPADKGLKKMVPLMDCVLQRWTATESRAVAGYLSGKTQEEIATESPLNSKTGKPVSRLSVSKALIRAHWDTVTECVTYVENSLCNL